MLAGILFSSPTQATCLLRPRLHIHAESEPRAEDRTGWAQGWRIRADAPTRAGEGSASRRPTRGGSVLRHRMWGWSRRVLPGRVFVVEGSCGRASLVKRASSRHCGGCAYARPRAASHRARRGARIEPQLGPWCARSWQPYAVAHHGTGARRLTWRTASRRASSWRGRHRRAHDLGAPSSRSSSSSSSTRLLGYILYFFVVAFEK